MAERTLPFVNVAMWSGGHYSTATKGAKDVIDGATPLVLEAIRLMPNTGASNLFTFTDMGCADGGTSIDLVRQAVGAMRTRWKQRPITVVYSDQPRNDYNSLFHLVHGLTPIPTYLEEIEDVYVLAAATSFYRPILPAGTLNLGFSATAMHWLSRKPCDLTDHVQAVGAEGAELAAFAEQGRRDWETILLHRARELTPGGRLVLVNFGKDEAGRYLGNTGGVNMFDTFNVLWQRFAAEAVISAEEYVRMTLPQYYKTAEEFTDPLTDTASPVYRAGLRLEQCETRVVPCPFAAEFRQHGDATRFAHEYIPTLRSWTESTFLAALSPNRPLEERQGIIDRYYSAYETLVRENPVGHGMDYVHIYLTIAKTEA
jgi:SAM dependent carboxyl methyltransferase